MNHDDVVKLLSAHEWTDVEFKEAQQAVPGFEAQWNGKPG
jgi:hypothetical protein